MVLRKTERDLTQSYNERPYINSNSTTNWQNKNTKKNFDYTTIADRLRTVSWSNTSHQTGLVKPVYGYSNFPLTTKAVLSKGHIIIISNTHRFYLCIFDIKTRRVKCAYRNLYTIQIFISFRYDITLNNVQLKYTIEGEAEPREIGLVKGNQNLANFRNGIL